MEFLCLSLSLSLSSLSLLSHSITLLISNYGCTMSLSLSLSNTLSLSLSLSHSLTLSLSHSLSLIPILFLQQMLNIKQRRTSRSYGPSSIVYLVLSSLAALSWTQCYKTFYECKLRVFFVS
jgi:hypothetical protein